MSTDKIIMQRDLLIDPLTEIIENECLDIVDGEEMTARRFAGIVLLIAGKIRLFNACPVDWVMHIGTEDYAVRVNNKHKGFVSVTNEDGDMGVSYTEYYPYFVGEDGEDDFSALLSIAQMINEAWYLCNN